MVAGHFLHSILVKNLYGSSDSINPPRLTNPNLFSLNIDAFEFLFIVSDEKRKKNWFSDEMFSVCRTYFVAILLNFVSFCYFLNFRFSHFLELCSIFHCLMCSFNFFLPQFLTFLLIYFRDNPRLSETTKIFVTCCNYDAHRSNDFRQMSAVVLTNGEKQKMNETREEKGFKISTNGNLVVYRCIQVALLRAQIWMYSLRSTVRFQR